MKQNIFLKVLLVGTIVFSAINLPTDKADTKGFSVISYAASEKLEAPSQFKAKEITKTTITLTWKDVSGADAYRVYIFNSETDEYESYKSTTANSCTVKALSANTTYKFKVAALIKNGNKYSVQTKSDKISITTAGNSKLSAPSNIITTPTTSTIKLTWDKVMGADAYNIYSYSNSSKSYELYKTVAGTSCTVKNLNDNTKYRFKIETLLKSNGKYIPQSSKIISATTKKETIINKKTPTEFKAPIGGNSRKDVLNNSGIANWKLIDSMKSITYTGDVMFASIKSKVYFGFNKNDQLINFMLFVPSSYSTYSTLLSVFKNKLGNQFDLDYTDDGNLCYSWGAGSYSISIEYDSSNKVTMIHSYWGNYV